MMAPIHLPSGPRQARQLSVESLASTSPCHVLGASHPKPPSSIAWRVELVGSVCLFLADNVLSGVPTSFYFGCLGIPLFLKSAANLLRHVLDGMLQILSSAEGQQTQTIK